jgi:hypothetical protein
LVAKFYLFLDKGVVETLLQTVHKENESSSLSSVAALWRVAVKILTKEFDYCMNTSYKQWHMLMYMTLKQCRNLLLLNCRSTGEHFISNAVVV